MKKKSLKKKSVKNLIKKSKKTSENHKKTFLVFSIVFVVLVLSFVLFYYAKGTIGKAYIEKCTTAECFLEKADICELCEYTIKIGTSTVKMEILEGCKLRKTILDFDNTEPKEIREFFKGKSMTCDYKKGYFDEDFAYQISGPLDECKGPLVNAIKAVI